MTKNEYIAKLFKLRRATNTVMSISDKRILRVLEKALQDIVKILDLKEKDTVTYQVYSTKRAALEASIRQMSYELNVSIGYGMRETADTVSSIYSELTRGYASGRGYSITTNFNTIPIQAVRNQIARVWSDGQTFSSRIWRLDDLAHKGVNDILASGMARGESAVNMSKRLRQYLLNSEITPNVSWTTGVQPSVTGKGSIHYNALRLARTEINNSYRETLVVSSDTNPIILGVKWNLSTSHPRPDVCDIWAKSDLYGFGEGVYPSTSAPIDHPNGLCFMTEVLRSRKDWGEPKPSFYEQRQLSESEILAPVASLSQGQKNAAMAQFNKVQSMVAAGRQLYRKAS